MQLKSLQTGRLEDPGGFEQPVLLAVGCAVVPHQMVQNPHAICAQSPEQPTHTSAHAPTQGLMPRALA